jgi:hypothetical protein
MLNIFVYKNLILLINIISFSSIYCNNIFNKTDFKEGNVGIGKLELNLIKILDNIRNDFIKIIPNKKKLHIIIIIKV